VIEVREYLDSRGRSAFGKWFDKLDARAAAKVATALLRLEQGNFSSAKGVGAGVFESRIDFGPGYRVYFGKDGDTLVILLGGGTKHASRRTSPQPKSCGGSTSGASGRRPSQWC
jgi:putative addiction module killer protein